MTHPLRLALLAAGAAAVLATPAAADHNEKYERKGPREWSYVYDDGREIEKEERKGREYKREWKRGDREHKYEEKADGSWKEEITDGSCKIERGRNSNGRYFEKRDC
ncbi:hypothetical protein P7228_04715 [Altererythrobacter arenosus]|uniref:Uncharacterized protein n=1 Tax=Altererythrobacter arenosus TaxID=3032592 RepID=A0ABY8FTP1_9SPHN|nr:hypothetical protein [Altererythrobacter sp. CAU 1644]WFL78369.1 hypothetical protein P7228_04715 [Altererythrobacter sp. CAU 1644]